MRQCKPAIVLVRNLDTGWKEAEAYGQFESTSEAQIWAQGVNFASPNQVYAAVVPWYSTSIG